MDARTFLDNFATIAEAPEGVRRLRELVIQLALQGRLIAQDSADEPADALVRRVDEARRSMIEERGWRTAKPTEPIDDSGLPSLPEGWRRVRLGELALPQAGFAFKSVGFNEAGLGIPLIRIRDIGNAATECHYEGDYRTEFLVEPGDYLIGMDGNFNIRRWAGQRALLNQRVTRLIFFSDELEKPFVTWALQEGINGFQGTRAYTTVQHLSGQQIASCPIPVPPASEQRRIVARVGELMHLCDQLESALERRRVAGQSLAAAATAQLAST